MNIQNYILPEWKKKIKDEDLKKDVELSFVNYSESMAEYLDRYMMREVPEGWFEGWTRYQFPLNTEQEVIDIHHVIAENFSEFIEMYRQGKKDEFNLEDNEINRFVELQEKYEKLLEERNHVYDELREEIDDLRKSSDSRPDRSQRRERKKTKKEKKQAVKQVKEEPKPASRILDHDYVYKKWMEMVESKPISKSYWHIHEYLSRYILDFAKEHSEDGRVTEELIEDFLEDYGKGKRPKTMNHYNRVIYRFWEFYENLVKNEDPMEVW